jgi:hypothetical protein
VLHLVLRLVLPLSLFLFGVAMLLWKPPQNKHVLRCRTSLLRLHTKSQTVRKFGVLHHASRNMVPVGKLKLTFFKSA